MAGTAAGAAEAERTDQPAADTTRATPVAPAPRPAPPAAGSVAGTPRPVPPRPHATPAPGRPPSAPSSAPAPGTTSAAAAIVHPVSPASTDPSRWGRVADDGTVYLHTPDGERAVGCWQAGAPVEGLAHFARRFDDLLTEAELLSSRLAAGSGDAKHTLSSARQLRDGLADAAVVGDVAGLARHLDALAARAEEAISGERAAREASRAQAIERKERLAAEAEELAGNTTQWKQAGDRFKEILEEWRTIRGIDRKADEQLWRRFSRARDAFNRRRGSHFAELDRQRAAAKTRKEELVAEAESLSDSTEWSATAARYKQLMADWKTAGRAQKDADDALWQRFRAAQEAFFTHRSTVFSERDAEFAANAARKEQLLAEAAQIDTGNADSARAALRSIHERWEAAGKVPRDRIRELEDRMRAAEERIRGELDRRWRRSDPETEARVDQFRHRVEQFEAQAAKARAAGDTRRAEQAEGQAEQWREWLATAEKAVQR
ncbi:MAG: DUF349 domain-containing protein [Pseudonocardia sp.]|nr:DUF349 domain-containing protein [Pseudonocardia sp.]